MGHSTWITSLLDSDAHNSYSDAEEVGTTFDVDESAPIPEQEPRRSSSPGFLNLWAFEQN